MLRAAVEMGWRVFDTAEMYASGGAETVLGHALAQAQRTGLSREELFVVSKALPENASAAGVVGACENSLRRLQLDCLDLYLVHWPSAQPLADTVRGFEELRRGGLIRHWGVSNFDLPALRRLMAVPGGKSCACNQVHYAASARGVEFDLLPWQTLHQMPLMAYSPLDQGLLADAPGLHDVALRYGATPAQIALAWLLSQPGVMPIPKAASLVHLRQNWAAQDLELDAADRQAIDRHFPAPRSPQVLSVR